MGLDSSPTRVRRPNGAGAGNSATASERRRDGGCVARMVRDEYVDAGLLRRVGFTNRDRYGAG